MAFSVENARFASQFKNLTIPGEKALPKYVLGNKQKKKNIGQRNQTKTSA